MHPATKFSCPCCGHLVHEREPGFHQSCPICGWHDELVQLHFSLMPGSSNTVSLQEVQGNFLSYEAAERRYVGQTRTPEGGERLDPGWRPLDQARDNCEEPMRGTGYADSYPWPDTTVLYYWRASYWRRLVG